VLEGAEAWAGRHLICLALVYGYSCFQSDSIEMMEREFA
jgi:hypothetical protein